jgi:hypothetical protein
MMTLSKGLFFAAVLMFGTSMVVPAIELRCCGARAWVPGYAAFQVGAIFVSPWPNEGHYGERLFLFAVWLANPAFLLGACFFCQNRSLIAVGAGVVALGLGALMLTQNLRLLPGYYLWLSSFGLLAMAGLRGYLAHERAPVIPLGYTKKTRC